jgi:hypothetical protein
MIPRQWIFGAVGAMTVLTVIGCYSHYPSSVYGPRGYPGFYSTPPGGQIPQGGTIISPGLPPQGSGATLSPGANSYGSQSPANSVGSTNRWQPKSDAPAFNADRDGVPASEADKPVPDYNDPTSFNGLAPRPFNTDDDFRDTNRFGDEDANKGKESGGAASNRPFGETDENESPFDGAATNGTNDDPFVSPLIPLTPVSTIRDVADGSSTTQGKKPNPYKFDRQTFRWLRGVVDYDDEAKTWNIIYSLRPDPKDKFGGSIALLGADRFGTLNNNDVVLVEGGVDVDHLDAFGKPQFRVDRLERLKPIE